MNKKMSTRSKYNLAASFVPTKASGNTSSVWMPTTNSTSGDLSLKNTAVSAGHLEKAQYSTNMNMKATSWAPQTQQSIYQKKGTQATARQFKQKKTQKYTKQAREEPSFEVESTESNSHNSSQGKYTSMNNLKSSENMSPSQSTNGDSEPELVTDFQQPQIDETKSNILVIKDKKKAANSEVDEECSGYQSTDFQTAYENQSDQNYGKVKIGDSLSENDQSSNEQKKMEGVKSRRGSFSIETESNDMNNSTIIDSEVTSATNEQEVSNVETSKFKLNAIPFKMRMPGQQLEQKEEEPTTEAAKQSAVGAGLNDLTLDNEFTPSTPYVHKFRTELCKIYELYGKCKWGDECSFAHGRTHMMVKTDVSVLYKTKLCKKYSANGYCPYGMRCQFIHDLSESNQQQVQTSQKIKQQQQQHVKTAPMNPMTAQFVPTMPIQKITEAPKSCCAKQEVKFVAKAIQPVEAVEAPVAVVPKKDLSVKAVAFVPQIPTIVAATEIVEKVEETTTEEPTCCAEKKKTLKVECKAFVPKPIVIETPAPPIVVAKQASQQTGLGGFGNKSTVQALATQKVNYSEVLVHCVKVSIQEYQKKSKMYQKKVNKKKYIDQVEQPNVQYINIYAHGNVPRLSCFKKITDASILEDEIEDDNEGGYFYGDSTAYEQHLDKQLGKCNKAMKEYSEYQQKSNQQQSQMNYQPQQTQNVNQYSNSIFNYLSQMNSQQMFAPLNQCNIDGLY